MEINVQKGITWREILAGGFVGAAIMMAANIVMTPDPVQIQPQVPAQVPAQVQSQVSQVGTQEYEVKFFDEDGNPIKIPQAETIITRE